MTAENKNLSLIQNNFVVTRYQLVGLHYQRIKKLAVKIFSLKRFLHLTQRLRKPFLLLDKNTIESLFNCQLERVSFAKIPKYKDFFRAKILAPIFGAINIRVLGWYRVSCKKCLIFHLHDIFPRNFQVSTCEVSAIFLSFF